MPSQADVSVSLPDIQYEHCEGCFPFTYAFFTVTVRNEGPRPATDVVVQVQQGDLD